MNLLWTKEGLLNLEKIQDYISADNPVTALKFIDELLKAAETLIDYPEKGMVVPELSHNMIRELIYKNYRIIYLVKKGSLTILTVFEWHKLLKMTETLKGAD